MTPDELITCLKALAAPPRQTILRLLSRDGGTRVADIVEATGFDQSTTSHHLKVLRQAGLIRVERRGGTERVQHVVPDRLAEIAAAVRGLLR